MNSGGCNKIGCTEWILLKDKKTSQRVCIISLQVYREIKTK